MVAEIFGLDGVVLLVIVVVVLFGGAAIPKFARNLGSAKSEFEKGLRDSQPTAAESQTAHASDETGPAANK